MEIKFNISFLLFCLVICANANYLSPDFTPLELQSIGNVLVQSYLHEHLIQRKPTLRNTMLSVIQKGVYSSMQYVAITGSLVAANYISSILVQPKVEALQLINSTLSPSKLCNHDFGCDDNVCWRTCNGNGKNNAEKAWCYSTPDVKRRKYQQCVYNSDCSPCWECLGPCNEIST